MHLNCCMVKPLPSIKMTVITIQGPFFFFFNIKASRGTHIELYAFLCWLYRCARAIWCVAHTICPCVKWRTRKKNTSGTKRTLRQTTFEGIATTQRRKKIRRLQMANRNISVSFGHWEWVNIKIIPSILRLHRRASSNNSYAIKWKSNIFMNMREWNQRTTTHNERV